MANKKKSPENRTQNISITFPNWVIQAVDDMTTKEKTRSSIITRIVIDSLMHQGDKAAIEKRMQEIDDMENSLDEEREGLASILSAMATDIKRLDDPDVIMAAEKVAKIAATYHKNDGELMPEKGIRNMAEKYLKGPMPAGFIEKVRKLEMES
jgi:metal-responsive CopG/Arc/MetJ family transcriptional regulator